VDGADAGADGSGVAYASGGGDDLCRGSGRARFPGGGSDDGGGARDGDSFWFQAGGGGTSRAGGVAAASISSRQAAQRRDGTQLAMPCEHLRCRSPPAVAGEAAAERGAAVLADAQPPPSLRARFLAGVAGATSVAVSAVPAGCDRVRLRCHAPPLEVSGAAAEDCERRRRSALRPPSAAMPPAAAPAFTAALPALALAPRGS